MANDSPPPVEKTLVHSLGEREGKKERGDGIGRKERKRDGGGEKDY